MNIVEAFEALDDVELVLSGTKSGYEAEGVDALIEKIYGGFLSMRCRSCRHFTRNVVLSEVQDHGFCRSDHKSAPFTAPIDFGCVYWEERE